MGFTQPHLPDRPRSLPPAGTDGAHSGLVLTWSEFRFGDSYLLNGVLIKTVQDEAQSEYGGLGIDWPESEVLSSGIQHYKLIDTALGVIQRTWNVADVVNQQRRAAHGPITLASSGCARRSRD